MELNRTIWKWSALAVAGTIAAAGPMMGPKSPAPPNALATVRQSTVATGKGVEAEPERAAPVEPAISRASNQTRVELSDAQRDNLADELSRWVTRHPRQLVDTIAELAESQPLPLPPTYLLSIAWAETRGKVLAVSPAGAAGLAQATPAAYLLEGFDGKLYVTNQYLIGTRAYIMKKPLGDAMTISDLLLKKNTAANRAKAKELLAHAIELRQEGMDELEALRPVANDTFFAKIAEADAHNLRTLEELERIIDRGAPRAVLRRYDKRVSGEYRQLMNLQRVSWERYGKQLEARRDTLLRTKFGKDPVQVIQSNPYEAGEYLGDALDARFSPTKMAAFLAAHLSTKQQQALELGAPADEIDAWTAALYNGGAVNIRRMQAGLIDNLRETQKYMKLVPSRTEQLERSIG
jgi:hypothetical protein